MNAFDVLAGWRLKAMLGLIVVAVLGGVMLWGRHDAVADERKRMVPVIASYELRIATLVARVGQLEGLLTASNERVEQLKTDAEAREKAAAAALKAARTQADRYRLRAAQIAAARPTGDQCVAARDLVVGVLSEERK